MRNTFAIILETFFFSKVKKRSSNATTQIYTMFALAHTLSVAMFMGPLLQDGNNCT